MNDSSSSVVREPTPHDKFTAGMRAIFGTTKEESDEQLRQAAERRKRERATKKQAKQQPG